MRRSHIHGSAGVFALVLSAARVALAQDASDLARRELIAQAEQARVAGDHAHALELALRAGALHWTPSLRLLAAREHEALGHPVEALGLAMACAREAEVDSSIHLRDDLLRECRAVVSATEPQVGRIRIHVSEHPAGLHVRVANADVPDALLDEPYPVAPGEIVVTATAPDRVPTEQRVTVAAGTVVDATVVMEVVAVAPAPVVATPPTPVRVTTRGPGAGPWVLMGVGVGGMLVGGAVGLFVWPNEVNQQNPTMCNTSGCSPDAQAAYNRGELGTYLPLGIGGAAVAGGLLWYILAPRTSVGSTALQWGIMPVGGGVAATVEGTL